MLPAGVLPLFVLPESGLPAGVLPPFVLPESGLLVNILPTDVLLTDVLPADVLPADVLQEGVLPEFFPEAAPVRKAGQILQTQGPALRIPICQMKSGS